MERWNQVDNYGKVDSTDVYRVSAVRLNECAYVTLFVLLIVCSIYKLHCILVRMHVCNAHTLQCEMCVLYAARFLS